MDTLRQAIVAYQTALDQLAAEKTDAYPSLVMAILLARDHLAQALANSTLSHDLLTTVHELDKRLQANTPHIDTTVGRAMLAAWRESAHPSDAPWWWRLDERAAAADPKPSPLWAITAGFFLTLAISFSADIARRFLSVGPDFVGVFSTIVQAFVALLAGRSLTETGQKNLERVLGKWNVSRRWAPAVNTGFALTVLVAILGLRLSLPSIARLYNDQGVQLQQGGHVTSAIQNYQRAISLSPNYAEAHYNLGTAYEDILAYDLAMISYQTALRSDARMYAAYNNLARVYILYKNDFANALSLLATALDLKINLSDAETSIVRYSLLKNHAWANLGLKYYVLAESDLKQALELRPEGAAAHCLLAQVLEARNRTHDALLEWEACLRYEKTDVVPVEARWVGMARERLSEGIQQ